MLPVILLLSVALSAVADKAEDRLKMVASVFVKGNNQAADKAREVLRTEATCLTLVPSAENADAVLEIATESQTQGGVIGAMGGRSWAASGTLTMKSGELVWSRSERFSDAPFMSGAKTAGELLVKRLAKDAGCKDRQKRRGK